MGNAPDTNSETPLIDLLEGTERPQVALYRLKVTVKQTIEGTAVQTNGSITRYSYTMVANYELSDIHSGKDVTKEPNRPFRAKMWWLRPQRHTRRAAGAQKLGVARHRGPHPHRSPCLFFPNAHRV